MTKGGLLFLDLSENNFSPIRNDMKPLIFTFLLFSLTHCTFSQNKKFKPKRGMERLSVLKGKAELKVGQKAYYQTTVHGSVGVAARVNVDNSTILKLVDTHFAYKNAQKAKMSGGDKGTKTFIFEALKSGSTTIIVKDVFRSRVKNTYKITINVK